MGCRGELRGSSRKVPGSPVLAAVLASTTEVFGSPMTAAAPASMTEVSGSSVTAAVPASATVGSFLGFSGAVVTNRRMGDVTHTSIAVDGKADAAHNSFSPLSGLGSVEGLCFGEREMTLQWIQVRREEIGVVLLLSLCCRAKWVGLSCFRMGLSIY